MSTAPALALTTVRNRLRTIDAMQRSSLVLAANSGVSAALGFLYWIVAARFYDTSVVGETAAVISTVQLLATVAELNLTTVLVRFLPTAGARSTLFAGRAYLCVFVVGLAAAALAFPLLADLALVGQLLVLGPLGVLVVLLSVPTWALFAVQDGAAIGARAPGWVLAEKTIFGVAKLVLLVLFAGTLAQLGVFASWIISMVLVVVLMVVVLFRRLLPRHSAEPGVVPEVVTRRDITAFMTIDNVTLVAITAGVQLLPALVVSRAGSDEAAYLYAAWSVQGAFDLALINVANSLTVEGARNQSRLGSLAGQMLRRILVLAVPAVAAVALAAPLVLSLYGPAYAAEGTAVLQLTMIALLPRAVIVVWMSVSRVQRRLGRILALHGGLTVAFLGATWLLVPEHGITVVGSIYLVAQAVGAVVAAAGLLPLLRGRVTAPSDVPSHP